MATPYITAAMLASAPAGVSWTVIPSLQATSAENAAEVMQACWKATSIIDGYCHQPLRATYTTHEENGPGTGRCVSVDRATCRGTLIARRGPVVAVPLVQICPASSFGAAWTTVTPGQYKPRHPVLRPPVPGPDTGWSGGYVIDVAPQWITWEYCRGGFDVRYVTLTGWPHTSLTADAAASATTVEVDDVTGWAGAGGNLYDGPATESPLAVEAAADTPLLLADGVTTVPAGPGTLALAAGLGADHPAGTILSAMPPAVIHAAVLAATVQALEGIDAVATQALNGQFAGGTAALAEQYELILDDGYVRVA